MKLCTFENKSHFSHKSTFQFGQISSFQTKQVSLLEIIFSENHYEAG